ncbi:hypothetical protein ACFWNK_38615 [Streptomyces sp. NPDC058417]|uniref:hypothetical protein n=1 Tax=unclassified Streptomyces TaxID=2593676 RepID=UPI003652BD8B
MIERSSFVFLPPGSTTAPTGFQIESASERSIRINLEIASRVTFSVRRREERREEGGRREGGSDGSVGTAWREVLEDHFSGRDGYGEESGSFIAERFDRKAAVKRAADQGFVKAEAAGWFRDYGKTVAPHRDDIIEVDVSSGWRKHYKDISGMDFSEDEYIYSDHCVHDSKDIVNACIRQIEEDTLGQAPVCAVGPLSGWEAARDFAASEWGKSRSTFDRQGELEPGRLPGTSHWTDHETNNVSRAKKIFPLLGLAGVAAALSPNAAPRSGASHSSDRDGRAWLAPGQGVAGPKKL